MTCNGRRLQGIPYQRCRFHIRLREDRDRRTLYTDNIQTQDQFGCTLLVGSTRYPRCKDGDKARPRSGHRLDTLHPPCSSKKDNLQDRRPTGDKMQCRALNLTDLSNHPVAHTPPERNQALLATWCPAASHQRTCMQNLHSTVCFGDELAPALNCKQPASPAQ